MLRPAKPHLLLNLVLLTFALSLGAFGLASEARSQEGDPGVSKAAPNFSRLQVKPPALSFKRIVFPAGTSPEMASFTILNDGKGTALLTPTVSAPTGKGATSFTILSNGGTLAPLAPGQSTIVTVQFQPVNDGAVAAEIAVTAPDVTRGPKSHNVHLAGSAKGTIPTPSPVPTLTATPTAAPTPAPGPVSTDKNSSNAPGVTISGTTVTVYVPLGSDSDATHGAVQVVVENGGGPLPGPSLIATNRVNSCTPSSSGEIVCSGQGGSVNLIPAGGGTPIILPLSAGAIPDINYAAGDCMGCGAMVDDLLSPPLGIISSGLGFVPIDLSAGAVLNPIATSGVHADEAVAQDFGYDMAHHLILSANYTVDPTAGFASTPAHFQIVNISDPANPVIYELLNDKTVLNNNGRTCTGNGGTTNSDMFPDTTALDTSTDIAYVSFHTPSDCFSAPPNDIAMFDLSQATFTAGTPNTWTTPSMAIQPITGIAINGIDPISVEAVHHLALVGAGDNNFGVLQLPSSSGTGTTPSISDWVNAEMPNDPNGALWTGLTDPAGLATYVSPNTGKVMGVLMNNPKAAGVFTGPTFVAIVDMDDLLNPTVTTRDPSNSHKVDSSVNLLTSNIVRFVPLQ